MLSFQNRIRKGPELPGPEQLRFYVYGLCGTGKTQFATSVPGLLIDVENQSGFVLEPKAKVIIPEGGEDFEKMVNELAKEGPRNTGFKVIALDSIEAIASIMVPWMTEEKNRQFAARKISKRIQDIRTWKEGGGGWGDFNERVTGLVLKLAQAGFGVVVIGHGKEETIESGIDQDGRPVQKVVLRPRVNAGIRQVLYEFTHFVGKAQYGIGQKTTGGGLKTERRYELNLSVPEMAIGAVAMAKARLVPFMENTGQVGQGRINIDVTGFRGWDLVAKRYNEACTRAMESLNKAGQDKPQKEKPSANN